MTAWTFPTQISFPNDSTFHWHLIGRSQEDNVTRSTLSSSRLPVVSQLLNETVVRRENNRRFRSGDIVSTNATRHVQSKAKCIVAISLHKRFLWWTPSMILPNCNHRTCGDADPFCGYLVIWRIFLSFFFNYETTTTALSSVITLVD